VIAWRRYLTCFFHWGRLWLVALGVDGVGVEIRSELRVPITIRKLDLRAGYNGPLLVWFADRLPRHRHPTVPIFLYFLFPFSSISCACPARPSRSFSSSRASHPWCVVVSAWPTSEFEELVIKTIQSEIYSGHSKWFIQVYGLNTQGRCLC